MINVLAAPIVFPRILNDVVCQRNGSTVEARDMRYLSGERRQVMTNQLFASVRFQLEDGQFKSYVRIWWRIVHCHFVTLLYNQLLRHMQQIIHLVILSMLQPKPEHPILRPSLMYASHLIHPPYIPLNIRHFPVPFHQDDRRQSRSIRLGFGHVRRCTRGYRPAL